MNQDLKSRLASWCDEGMVWSLYGLIFFVPISIAFVDTFAAFAIFFYFLKKICHGKSLYPAANVLNRPLEILIIVVFVSVLQSQFLTTSLFAFIGKFGKGVFLYFCFVEAFVQEKRLRIFLNVFLTSVALVALSGISQLYLGKDFIRGHVFIGYRMTSSFTQPNTFGAFLLIPLAIVGHLLYASAGKGKPPLRQVVLALLMAVLLISLCWTYSRASWVGYLSSLALMVFMDRRKILYGLCLFIIVVYVFLPNLTNMRHMSLFKDTLHTSMEHKNFLYLLEEGGSGRFGFWKNAIVIIKKYPLWGSGLNTYAKDLKRFSLPPWYAHNCYLQMAAETGLIGLFCFLWLLMVFFKNSLYSLKIIADRAWFKPLLEGLIAGIGGLLINSFLDNSLYTVQLSVLFWLTIGFSISIMYLNPQGTFGSTSLSK